MRTVPALFIQNLGDDQLIYSLNGILIYKDNSNAVVECAGVGYKCLVSLKTAAALPECGEKVRLYTFMQVRDDAVDLFGFISKDELEAFRLITSVNGVGPRLGIAILSDFTPDQIMLYIASGDSKALTAASGVGAKLASRIVLELKDKVGTVDLGGSDSAAASRANTAGSVTRDAVEALTTFGFTASEASVAVGKCDPSLSVDEIIKQALKLLSRQV